MTSANEKLELLAPVGSFESLQAAINAGCDSIYFGVGDLNMRSRRAKNFRLEDLDEIIEICNRNNVKTYLTLNSIVYDNELEKIKELVKIAKEKGVNAIIASDMSVVQECIKKKMSVNISTQLSISNIESLKFYAQFADRIVLARELRLEQIENISKEIRKQKIQGPGGKLVELEIFGHGALCVAVSGRCNMSLYCHNESANRGKCLHMCRRQYKIIDVETEKELLIDNNFVMSPADLCTIGMLPEIIKSGASILKIEGRGRSADYVDTVIKCYREAIDSIEEGTYNSQKIKNWNKKLGTVFNRGKSLGLYRGRKYDEWAGIYGSKATKKKIIVGIINKYYPKIQVAEIRINHGISIKEKDEYMIIGNTTGVVRGKLNNIVVDEKVVKTAKQGDEVTFKVNKRVRRGDKMYILKKK